MTHVTFEAPPLVNWSYFLQGRIELEEMGKAVPPPTYPAAESRFRKGCTGGVGGY